MFMGFAVNNDVIKIMATFWIQKYYERNESCI